MRVRLSWEELFSKSGKSGQVYKSIETKLNIMFSSLIVDEEQGNFSVSPNKWSEGPSQLVVIPSFNQRPRSGGKLSKGAKAAVAVATILVCLSAAATLTFLIRRRRRRRKLIHLAAETPATQEGPSPFQKPELDNTTRILPEELDTSSGPIPLEAQSTPLAEAEGEARTVAEIPGDIASSEMVGDDIQDFVTSVLEPLDTVPQSHSLTRSLLATSDIGPNQTAPVGHVESS